MSDVRYSLSVGFELRCPKCREWWPIDNDDPAEFWWPKQGLARCRACWLEYYRRDQRERRKDPVQREAMNAAARESRAKPETRKRMAEYSRRYRVENRERKLAYQREYYARNAETLRAKAREYHRQYREIILAKKHERDARRDAA